MNTKKTFSLSVGDGVSVRGYSDVSPYEVVKISKSGKKATIRQMSAELDPSGPKPEFIAGGFAAHCANQRELKYIIKSDENGATQQISLRAIKCDPQYNEGFERVEKWVSVGQSAKMGHNPISEGARYFCDYNF